MCNVLVSPVLTYSSYSFSTSASVGGGEWSRPGFSPGERTAGTHCTRGWVDLRAALDTELEKKTFRLCRRANLDRPVVQPVVRHYTDWATRLTQLYFTICKFFTQALGNWLIRVLCTNTLYRKVRFEDECDLGCCTVYSCRYWQTFCKRFTSEFLTVITDMSTRLLGALSQKIAIFMLVENLTAHYTSIC
jgi:hypothetical protein